MSEHRGVPAAEKYADLEATGAERPRCSCHGEEKLWQRDTEMIPGGHWTCAIRHREAKYRWRRAYPEKARKEAAATEARRLQVFGQRFTVPDVQFREYAVQLREERRRALKEASNG